MWFKNMCPTINQFGLDQNFNFGQSKPNKLNYMFDRIRVNYGRDIESTI